MQSNVEKKRPVNPSQNASLLSKLLFIFAIETIRNGTRKNLEHDDIYEVMKEFKTDKLGDRLENEWEKELKKKNPHFLFALFRIFGLRYLLLGIWVNVMQASATAVEPILMGKLASYFEKGSKVTREGAILYGSALIATNVIWRTFDNSYLFMQEQLSLRIRIACTSLLYRKSLKVNLDASTLYAGGTAVTIMTKDITQFTGAADYGHLFFEVTTQLIIMTYMMYNEIGSPALFGSSVLFIFIPVFRIGVTPFLLYYILDQNSSDYFIWDPILP